MDVAEAGRWRRCAGDAGLGSDVPVAAIADDFASGFSWPFAGMAD